MKLLLKHLRYQGQMFRNRLYRFSRRNSCVCRPNPLLVFGNQKSGTSAIAGLLGAATGQTVQNDLFTRYGAEAIPVLKGEAPLSAIWAKSAPYLERDILKEPEFVFFSDELSEIFAGSKRIFIVREPFDNIRSIYNRLSIDGRSERVDRSVHREIAATRPLWLPVLEGPRVELTGESLIETLAMRWKFAANVYLQDQAKYLLVRYETFLADRVGTIEQVATELGFSVTKDITAQAMVSFQPPGQPMDPLQFFGEENVRRALDICRCEAAALGYAEPAPG